MRNRIMTVLFCAASILSLWAVAAAKPASPYTIDTPYEYPYVPGTQEWVDLGDTLARRQTSQVPDEVLAHMTTDALLQTVLDYPFLSDMYAFNTIEIGYKAVRNHCNSLREFENRPDYLQALSQYRQASYSLNRLTLKDYMADTLNHIYTSTP